MKPASPFQFPARIACRLNAAVLGIVSLSLGNPASAANLWDGGGGSGDWNTPNNWDNNLVPTGSGSNLTFAGLIQPSTNNNSPLTQVAGFTFNAGAAAFTLAGTGLNLNGSIANNSSNPQTISLTLALVNNSTVSGASAGASVNLGTVTNSGGNRILTNNLAAGNTLTIAALNISNNNSARTLTIAGTGTTRVTGLVANGGTGAGGLSFTGTGTLKLNGAAPNTYTGTTTAGSGTLELDYSNLAAPADLINSASPLAAGGTLRIIGKAASATAQTFNGISTVANRSSSLVVNQNGASTVDITLGAMTRNLQSTTDFTLPAAGTTTTTTSSATNGVATSNFGTAYQTVGGLTWLEKSGAGPFTLGAFPEGSYSTTYAAANNVDVTAGDTPADATVNTLRFGGEPGKILVLSGTNTIATGGLLITPAATDSQMFDGFLRGNADPSNRELLVINHGSIEIFSTIVNNDGASALTLAGPGTTTLYGANTFTGTVSINQGITRLGSSQSGVTSSALGAGNAGAPTLVVAPGATLDLFGSLQTVGVASGGGTILNNFESAGTLTLKSGAFSCAASGGNFDLVSDVGAGNIFQLNTTLTAFSGNLVHRSGIIQTNTFQSDLGAAALVLDVTAAAAVGANTATFATNNRFFLNSGTGSMPNHIDVASNGFIGQGAGARTLSGNITGTGVLHVIDGTDTLSGDNSSFGGTFNLWSSNTKIIINSTLSSSEFAKYVFSTEGTVAGTCFYAANIPGGGTVHMGELATVGVTTNSFLQNNANNTTATFSVGGLGTDSTYGGTIRNGTGTSQITAFTKTGGGILTLAGTSTHSGDNAVDSGTLLVSNASGSGLGSGNVTVAAAGTLGGSGSFTGSVSSSGIIAPGTSVGTLTTGPATLTAGSSLDIEVSGAGADKLVSTGVINLTGATLNVTELTPGSASSYVIAQGTGVSGPFASLSLPAGYSVSYNATQAVLNLTVASGYPSWAANPANGLTAGVNDGVNDDPDKDGIFNLLEFVFGGIPAGAGASDTSILPSVALVPAVNPTALRVTFERADLSEGDVTLKVQWSTDLATWGAPDEVTIGAVDAGIVDITENFPSAELDTVAVSIPLAEALNGKLYARVSVTRP